MSHSPFAGFEKEGEYLLNAVSENLSNSTIFFVFNMTENVSQNITQNLTQNSAPEIFANVYIENVTQAGYIQKLVTINGTVLANDTKINSNVSLSVKNPKGNIEYNSSFNGDDFSFKFFPKLSGTYSAELEAKTDSGH